MAAAEVTRAAVYRVLEWVATEQFAAEATSMVIRSALTQVGWRVQFHVGALSMFEDVARICSFLSPRNDAGGGGAARFRIDWSAYTSRVGSGERYGLSSLLWGSTGADCMLICIPQSQKPQFQHPNVDLFQEATATAAPARETSEEGVHEIDSCTVRHRGRAGKKRRGGWRGLLCCSSPSLAEDIVLQ